MLVEYKQAVTPFPFGFEKIRGVTAVLADTYFSAANAAGQHGATNTQAASVGSSDAHEAEVKETPISPKDILARYRLGIDPDTLIADFRGSRCASQAMVRARRINRLTIS